MFSAKSVPDRQRMDITADQALSVEDFNQLIKAIAHEAACLQEDWTAAVDFRGMWVDNLFINQQFEELQEALLANRAGKIGTLLDSDPIKMHLWQAGTRSKSNVITRRFYDQGEWERFLDQV